MYKLSISFLAAILLQISFSSLPSWWLWLSIAALWLGAVFIIRFYHSLSFMRCLSGTWLIALGLLGGGLYGTLKAQHVLDHRLPHALDASELTIKGRIVEIPRYQPHLQAQKLSFHMQVTSAENQKLSGKVRLTWYQGVPTDMLPGDEWQLRVKLKRPSGFMNPLSFDYERHLFRQQMIATGYVISKSDKNQRLNKASGFNIDQQRLAISHQLQQSVDDPVVASVLSALTVAIKHDMPQDLWETLQVTGTSHLLAISGLHIGMIAGFGLLFVRWIWFAFPRLYVMMPVQQAGLLVGATLAIVYAALAGFSVSTQRALMMVLVVLLALLLYRFISLGRILASALLMVLVIDPFSVLDAGFWLSFMAVALIFYALSQQSLHQQETWKSRLKQLLLLQGLLSFAMLPLTSLFFGTASWLSPVANLLAIPWVSVAIVPFALLGVLLHSLSLDWLANGVLSIAAFNIQCLLWFLDLLVQLPNSTLYLPKPPWWLLPFALFGVLLLFAPRHFPAKWLGILFVLPVFIYQPSRPPSQAFEFVLLDTGQSLSAVIKTEHHNLLYDTGFASASGFNIGERVIVPYLRAHAIQSVDRLVISHLDNDHRGGAAAVVDAMKIIQIDSSEPLVGVSQTTHRCMVGRQWQWDGVNFRYLHPEANHDYRKRNDRSCVLKIWNDHHQLLLTADAEKFAEKRMIFSQNNHLLSEVLLIPHHGSKTSSTLAFIKAVNPRLAVVNAGYQNRFGFPKPAIMKRYQALGIPVLNTAEQGAITIRFPAGQAPYRIVSERMDKAKFWHR